MLRDFVKLTASYSIINVFQKLADYLSVIFFISAFSATQYGIISANTLIILGLTSVFSLSLEGAVSRFYFKYLRLGELERFLGCVVSYIMLISISMGVLFLCFSKPLWGLAFKDLPFSPYIVLAILTAMLDPINRVYIGFLQIKRSVKEYGIFYNIYVFVRLILLSLAAFLYQSTELYFVAYFVSIAVCVPFSLYRLSRTAKWNLDLKYFKEAFSYSIYIVPVTVFSILNGLIGRAFIMDRMDTASVGVYSAGFNIGQVIYLIAMVFNMAYVSFFIQKYEEVGDRVGQEVQTMADVMFFLIFLSAFVISLVAPLCTSLLPDDYVRAIPLIPLFAFGGVANGLYFLSTNYLSLKQSLVKYKMFGLLVGVILNLAISLTFIDKWGIKAVAVGNFASIYASACILCLINRKKGQFRYSLTVYWLTLVLLVLTYGIFYGITASSSWGIRMTLIFVSLFLFYKLFDRYFFQQKNFLSYNLIALYNKYVKTFYRKRK